MLVLFTNYPPPKPPVAAGRYMEQAFLLQQFFEHVHNRSLSTLIFNGHTSFALIAMHQLIKEEIGPFWSLLRVATRK